MVAGAQALVGRAGARNISGTTANGSRDAVEIGMSEAQRDAAYKIQADTERKQAERASAELLDLLRQHHPERATPLTKRVKTLTMEKSW